MNSPKFKASARPKVWDKKWRIALYDVPTGERLKRDAIRAALQRIGFFQLQKSVWVYPFDCGKEIHFLISFFELTPKEFRLVTTGSIGDDALLRKRFRL